MTLHARNACAALGLVLTSVQACGYIGFEPHPKKPAEPSGADTGPDLRDAGDLDADAPDGSNSADASERDASDVDAGTGDLDADAPDADVDAATPDSSLDAATATQVSDYCAQIPALPDPPVLDGRVDGALSVLAFAPAGWTSKGGAPLPTSTTAEYALAFRPEGLYFYVRVYDPNRQPAAPGDAVWRGDGVELYVDDDGSYASLPSYDDPGTIQIVVAAPDNGTTPTTRANLYRDRLDQGAWTSPNFKAFALPDGYVVEALVEADALGLSTWSLTSGLTVGVDLGVNVSAGPSQDAGALLDGNRIGEYFLHVGGADCGGLPFCTPEAFCVATLID